MFLVGNLFHLVFSVPSPSVRGESIGFNIKDQMVKMKWFQAQAGHLHWLRTPSSLRLLEVLKHFLQALEMALWFFFFCL